MLKFMYTVFNYELFEKNQQTKVIFLNLAKNLNFRNTIVDSIVMYTIPHRIVNPVQ